MASSTAACHVPPPIYRPFAGPLQEESLADKFEYVMHGKVYRCEEQKGNKLGVFVSYGGEYRWLPSIFD